LELQGVVLFGLYIVGVASAMAVAFVLKRSGRGTGFQALMPRAARVSLAELA